MLILPLLLCSLLTLDDDEINGIQDLKICSSRADSPSLLPSTVFQAKVPVC